jgi:C1A family cysteine protease
VDTKEVFVLSWLLSIIVLAVLSVPAHAGDFGRIAPLNPAFESWRASLKNGRETLGLPAETRKSPDSHRISGKRPSPVNLGHLYNRSIVPSSRKALGEDGTMPVRFDLRETGSVSAVKDQGSWGTCWSFAAMGSSESSALGLGWEEPDFSEKHLAYFAYTDIDPTMVGFDLNPEKSVYEQGGSALVASSILSRWTGIVGESDAPYEDFNAPPPADAPNIALLKKCVIAPAGESFEENLKHLIQGYGAANIDVYVDEQEDDDTFGGSYNPDTAAFYYAGDSGESNHAVLAVGWDDGYPKENFFVEPPENGAWIVRNSWGKGWGDDGYFYVSYHDEVVGRHEDENAYAFAVTYPWEYDETCFHDPLGITGAYAVGEDNGNQWFSNVFSLAKARNISAVGLYVLNPDTTLHLSVYTETTADNPVAGNLALGPWTVNLDIPGYYVLDLERLVPVDAGRRFSIVVNVQAEDAEFPIAIEGPEEDYSSKATAMEGQSFVSADGVSWVDMADEQDDTNVCLKVFFAVGLEQAITALQVLAGEEMSHEEISGVRDVDGDGRIGFDEVFYALQVNAGLR